MSELTKARAALDSEITAFQATAVPTKADYQRLILKIVALIKANRDYCD